MPRGTSRYDEALRQGRLWTPKELGAGRLSCWFDFSQFGVVCDGSGNVQTIVDRSGNGNNGTQSTSGNRPAWAPTKIRGMPGVASPASPATYFNITALANTDPTAYIVFENTASGAYRSFFANQSGNNAPYFGMTNTSQLDMGRTSVVDEITIANSSTGYHVASVRFAYITGTGNVHVLTLNGAISTKSTSATTYSNAINQIFADRAGFAMNGGVGELLIWAGRHTDREMRLVEGYLAWKWDRKLAGAHPYARRPPLIGD